MLPNRFVVACNHAFANANIRVVSELSDAPTTNSAFAKITPILVTHALGTIMDKQT